MKEKKVIEMKKCFPNRPQSMREEMMHIEAG
jgi:hypothetical protein